VSVRPESQDSDSGEAPRGMAGQPLTAFPRSIVLTGFMGAGKTTTGRQLAERLGWTFIDVDTEIEAATGATIADLFIRHGEPWFRELEHDTICRLSGTDRGVIALGGGAIEDDRTRRLLLTAENTWLIHLEVSIESVLARCNGTDGLRPVLRDRANLEARYNRRLPLYQQAHVTIPTDSLTAGEVVEAVLKWIEFGDRS
jgi:shikimate kinase